jgi:hypothetical protein
MFEFFFYHNIIHMYGNLGYLKNVNGILCLNAVNVELWLCGKQKMNWIHRFDT